MFCPYVCRLGYKRHKYKTVEKFHDFLFYFAISFSTFCLPYNAAYGCHHPYYILSNCQESSYQV